MRIYRVETLEIHPDPGQSIVEIKDMIEKTQDLVFDKHDWIESRKVFMLVVRRKVELLPDTIK